MKTASGSEKCDKGDGRRTMRSLRVLFVEDSERDARLLKRQMEREGYTLVSERVETAEAMRSALENQEWDVVLSDYRLPHFSARAAQEVLKESGIDLPFIVISGTIDEEIAVESLKAGAHDFVMKGSLARLIPSIERGIGDAVARRERAAFEAAKKEGEARFQALIESTSDVVSILSEEGIILYESSAITRIFGYTPEELVGKCAFDFFHPNDKEESLILFQDLLNHPGEERTHTARFLSKEGSWKSIEVSARNLLHDPAVRGIVANSRDITRRRRAEEDLRQSEERFRLAAMATQEAIWEKDLASGKITWAANFFEFFHFDPNDVEPSHEWWLRRIDLMDRKRIESSFCAALESSAHFWMEEYDFLCGNGMIRTVIDRGYIQYSETGEPVRIVGAMMDITDKKRLEAQLRQVQRLDSIGRLASGIAHDLNNILTPIQMGADLLRAKPLEDSTLALVNTISDSAKRGAGIVRQILTFARGVAEDRSILQPATLLHEMHQMLREIFPRNIEIIVAIPQNLPAIRADATQLHQVLMNLCVNARDAMPGGGKLSISATKTDLGRTCQNLHPEAKPGQYIILTVGDTGEGIHPDVIEKLFDPFFTTKGPGQGTGLGLPTVLGIIRSHHGFITVESELGTGTVFRIYLPVTHEGEPESPEKAPDPGIHGNGELILVVDDEEFVRHLAQKALSKNGYQVIEAANGKEAAELFTKNADKIAIVLTDIMMPVMDGIALTRIIREQNPALPVITCSGLGHRKYQEPLRDLNVHAFLEKPYSIDQLLNIIRDELVKANP
ncbi:MAG: response regulator [Opitutales bacterium]